MLGVYQRKSPIMRDEGGLSDFGKLLGKPFLFFSLVLGRFQGARGRVTQSSQKCDDDGDGVERGKLEEVLNEGGII